RGFAVRCAAAADSRSAIVMVAHAEPERAVEHLARHGIIVDSRPGYVRISPHFYNTAAEIDHVVDALETEAAT
ncbi:MAG: hypothetical protein ACREM1_03640, partial [Longimicrobiales bacterium]